MSICGAVIVPHPPILLPEIGRGQERKIEATAAAYRDATSVVAGWQPETLVITSPHAMLYADYFHISPGKGASGSMAAFGAPGVRFSVDYDVALRETLIRLAQEKGLQAGMLGERDPHLDHGTMIPLYFLRKAGVKSPIVRIGLSGFSPLEHYQLGQCIAGAAESLHRRVAVVASGDLSHKLKNDGPYGFAAEGPAFDKQVTEAMASGDFLRMLTFDPSFCDRAAECGLRSFQIMAGTLDGQAVQSRLDSYEGTFGVGYAVAVFVPTGPSESRRFGAQYRAAERQRLARQKSTEDPWVRLARLSLETYVRQGKRLSNFPPDLPQEMTSQRAGVFVSLHLHGQLRGCIGTIGPITNSIAKEIARNAVSAGTQDPRFPTVRAEELDRLEYSVDVLGPTEPISSSAELDVKRYGVIVSSNGRHGLLLPNLSGIDTVEKQIDIARKKGGISPREPYTLERFEVVRHT